MSRELLQQALDALEFPHDSEWSNKAKAIEALQHALVQPLAKPEQVTVPFPSFMRKRIEEAIDLAINPKGMSVHDGKATVYAADLQRMIAVIDLAPSRKEWVGLTQSEINRSISNLLEDDTDPLMTLAYVIEEKLKEKNGIA